MRKIRDWIFLAVPGMFAACVYLAMLPGQYSAANFGEDGGDLLAAALTLGVPHPTGYPAYILLLRMFLGLPAASSYWKGALFSAAAAGLALVLLAFYVAYRGNFSTRSKISAIFASVALAFAPLFWSQAVIVEVQALQAVFVCLVFCWISLLEKGVSGRQAKILLLFLAWCGGVSLGNHLTIVFLFPLVVVAQFTALRNGMQRRWLAWQSLAFLAGSLVLFYLPLAARNYPPINWGNPQSVPGLVWLLTGSLYQNMLLGVTPAQFFERLGVLVTLLWNQFNFGIFGAVAGFLCFKLSQQIQSWGLAWIFLVSCAFYLTYNSRDSIVYLVPAWIVVAIWIGEGFTALIEKFKISLRLEKIASVILLICLFVRIPIAWNSINPSRDILTPIYLAQILAKASANAFVVTISDYDTFPLWFGHFGEKQRMDLRVVVFPLTQFSWYQDTLRQVYPDLVFPTGQSDQGWGDELVSLNSTRPVCRSENPDNDQQHIRILCGGDVLFEGEFSKNGN